MIDMENFNTDSKDCKELKLNVLAVKKTCQGQLKAFNKTNKKNASALRFTIIEYFSMPVSTFALGKTYT